jgi:hypothetical protein
MIMRGLWRLAKCERAGISEFGSDLDHFYASLAPLIGIPLAGAFVTALHGDWQQALVGFLARLVAVLVVPVAVYESARLFRRESLWLRTATALNWSFWMLFPALLVSAIFGAILAQCGLGMMVAELLTVAMMMLYLMWYGLFTLSAGLGLNFWQAGMIMLVSSAAVGVVSVLPNLLGLGPALNLPAS